MAASTRLAEARFIQGSVLTNRNLGSMSESEIYRREQEFHDFLATSIDAASQPPPPPDELEQDLLLRIEPLRGTRVLDLGCGIGNLTIELLARGAEVTALDLSPKMIETARQRVERFSGGGPVEWVVAPAEKTGLPDSSFDLVVGKWILHHADIGALAGEIHRVLRPAGRAIFIENSGTNPLLAFARKHVAGRAGVPRLGTEDEHPLVESDYAQLAAEFGRLDRHFPDFCFFRLFDRQVLRFRAPKATRALFGLDDWVWRTFPRARPYSFHVVVEVQK